MIYKHPQGQTVLCEHHKEQLVYCEWRKCCYFAIVQLSIHAEPQEAMQEGGEGRG